MATLIEIEGDVARVVERNVISTAPLQSVLPHLTTSIPVSVWHPRSAIWSNWSEETGVRRAGFLCELAPGIKNIVKGTRRYRLAMPWTYFWFTFSQALSSDPQHDPWQMGDHRIFHSNAAVETVADRLWSAFLPNTYEDGRICFGSTGVSAGLSLQKRVDQLVNTWYQTQFNDDLHGSRNHPLPFNGTLPNGWRLWVDATLNSGASAWTQFPEWQDTTNISATSYRVDDLLATFNHRNDPVPIIEQIPSLPGTPTFGRLDEWLHNLNNTQRNRLYTTLQILRAQQPTIFTLPVQVIPPNQPADDGGEPV